MKNRLHPDHLAPEKPALMLLGCPRSGTTLLTALLGTHPGISMLDEDLEGGLLRLTGNKLGGVKLCVPAQIHPTKRRNWVTRLISVSGGLRNRFGQLRTHSRLSLADYEQARSMRYVLLLREPRAVMASIQSRAGKRHAIAEQIVRDGLTMMADIANDPARSSLTLDYADLVADTEGTLRRLCDFLEVPFAPEMLAGAAHNHRYKAGTIHRGQNTGGRLPVPDDIMALYERLKTGT